ncbi:zinc finger protein [Saccharopolyspora antimicrobica]|uniref:zinc finger protein n=1 Tax=Saccharopolyspora antimicrobica TaxID=455193 RepID=UPI000B836DFF|nr:zinc finger protein [Saccharopolyspora antimicrobica]
MPTYQPHPFHWVPADGQRHASADPHPLGASVYSSGADVTTLCERTVEADVSELAWLWATCADCNAAARVLAGLPPKVGAE